LGVNATMDDYSVSVWFHLFQWAPTLGGECYPTNSSSSPSTMRSNKPFQWAPTLGGECYRKRRCTMHPIGQEFQWAPTLGGECYAPSSALERLLQRLVSMGTHPWG